MRANAILTLLDWLVNPFRLDGSDSGDSNSDSDSGDSDSQSAESASASVESADLASESVDASGESIGSPARARESPEEETGRRGRRRQAAGSAQAELSPEDYRDIPAR